MWLTYYIGIIGGTISVALIINFYVRYITYVPSKYKKVMFYKLISEKFILSIQDPSESLKLRKIKTATLVMVFGIVAFLALWSMSAIYVRHLYAS